MKSPIAVLTLCLTTGLLAVSASATYAQTYYVSDGISLTLVYGDPQKAKAVEWAAFYFARGARAGAMSQRWGVDTKATAAAVLQSVTANQTFERAYEKWCGCSWGPNTFFNALAPVALQQPSHVLLTAPQSAFLDRAHAAWDGFAALRDQFNTALQLAGEENLRPLASGPIAEFLSAMHETVDRFAAVSDQIARPALAALDRLDVALQGFNGALRRATLASTGALATLNTAPSPIPARGSLSFSFRDEGPNSQYLQYDAGFDGTKVTMRYTSNMSSNVGEARIADIAAVDDVYEGPPSANRAIFNVWCRSTACVSNRSSSVKAGPVSEGADTSMRIVCRPADCHALAAAIKRAIQK